MKLKKVLALVVSAMLLFSTAALADGYTAGTYEGVGAGRNGEIKVSVTVTDTEITAIDVVEHQETAGICDTPIAEIPAAIVAGQTLNVDAISGATLTSNGLMEAITAALTAAGADIDALKAKEGAAKTASEPVDATADVIVVGGGGAGLSAAITAAESGMSVILIEKTGVLGGNTLLSGGKWNAADTDIQSRTETVNGQIDTLKGFLNEDASTYPEGYSDTLVALQKQITDYLAGDTTNMFDSVELHIIQCYQGGLRQDLDGNWIYGDFDLVKEFCEQSLPTLHWIENSWEMPFQDNVTTVYGGLWKRGHSPVDESSKGAGYFTYGKAYADKLGVQFMMNTAGKSIIMEGDSAVGINAETSDGAAVTLHADKGVVIATGGYGGSVELVKQYNNYWPALPDELTTNNAPGITGDGIFMCRDVNADLVGMGFVQLMALSHPVTNSNTGCSTNPEQTLYVNKEGKRFVNEYAARDVIAAAAFKQTDGMFYSIDDIDTAHLRYTDEQLQGWVDDGYIWVGNTIEELAEQIGVDPATLAETVTTYDGYVESGVDADFGKEVMDMTIKTGPFYATPHKPNVHHTMGGVHINTSAEVIDTNGNVIPGLYAAGEVCGGIHAGNRLGGNAVADAFTFGRIAAQSIANAK
ncbi:MAG: FAD-dependent oxidoreductase [Eubacteriales bacterium]|nr:FAD-dependent oxidoreductase [Eubacteriales bacterium]